MTNMPDRSAEISNLMALSMTAKTKALAIVSGGFVEDTDAEHVDLLSAAFDVFGCDELYYALLECRPPTEDVFGNPIPSRAASVAEIGFAEGKQI